MSVYGVKGWVKVFSHTDPKQTIFDYQPWYLLEPNGPKKITVLEGKTHGKGLVVRIEGASDRNQAIEKLVGREVAVPAAVLPVSSGDTYYWRDLIGSRVVNQEDKDLGVLAEMLETGANDVMRVKADSGSIDDRERLLPWAPGDIVLDINLADAVLRVDWDADF